MMRSWSEVCQRFVLVGLFYWGVTGCQTTSERSSSGSSSSSSSSSSSRERGGSDDDVDIGRSFRSFTYSLSNDPQSSKNYDRGKASSIAGKLKSSLKNPTEKDREELIALMITARFAGAGLDDVVSIASKLVAIEIKKDVKRDIPELAKIELALAAIQSKKMAYAEYFINQLRQSKSNTIKAYSYSMEGIIALLDDRLPEAVRAWQDALRADKDHEPALINLGLTALKYGDVKTGLRMLGSQERDYAVGAALVTAERLQGKFDDARKRCESLLRRHEDYKPLLYNCALNEQQGYKNFDKAREYLKKFRNVKSDGGRYNEKAERILMRIEAEEDRIKREAAEKKSKAAQEAKSSEKGAAASDGAGAK